MSYSQSKQHQSIGHKDDDFPLRNTKNFYLFISIAYHFYSDHCDVNIKKDFQKGMKSFIVQTSQKVIIIMFLFLFFFFRNLEGVILETPNASYPTLDGKGFIFNNVSSGCNLNQKPIPPYQKISQNSITGEIIIQSQATSNCFVNYIMTPEYASYIIRQEATNCQLHYAIKIEYFSQHQYDQGYLAQYNETSVFNFAIMLMINKSNGTVLPIEIFISLTLYSISGERLYSNIHNMSGLLCQVQIYPLKIDFVRVDSKNQYNGVLDLSDFLRWLNEESYLKNDDILSEIDFRSNFTGGKYLTSLNYSIFEQNVYEYNQKIISNTKTGIEFYFSPTQTTQGDLQYLSYSKTIPIYKIGMYFVLNPNNITKKSRPCNGERIGYYKGGYHIHPQSALDFNYFPLDPGLKINYTILSNDIGDYDPITNPYIFSRCFRVSLRRDYSLQTNSFTNLADQTLVSEQIYICNKITQLLHAQDNLFEVFSYQNSNVIFQAYRRENKTVNQPRIYHFLGNFTGDKIQLDLFFFVSRLYQSGSFKENERISEISKCTRFHSGTGSYFFNPTVFPTKSELSFLKNCSIPGCIECDTALCVTCNPTENWSLINGSCVSSSNAIKYNNDTYLRQKSLSCLLSNDTGESCLTAPLPLKAQVALTLTSTPNIGMVLKLSQLVNLVDDFTFYIYINMTYGEQFHKFLYLMWNISMERWIPHSFSSFYYDIQDQYDQKTTIKRRISLPQLWNDLNEDPSFIRNTRDYWICSIPFTFLTFLLFHILFLVLRKFKPKLSKYLLKFKWFTILVANLFLNNIQLLAFRSFQQIYYIQAPSLEYQNIKIYFANHIVCFFILFCVVISACAGQFIIRILIGKNVKHSMDLVFYRSSTIWFMVLQQLLKITSGFMHASFYLDNTTKFSFLLGTQILIFFAITYFRQNFRRKALFVLMVYEYLLKIFIHLCLLLRVILKLNYQLKQIENQILGEIQITAVWVVIGVTSSELLTGFINESRLKISRTALNKLGQVSSTRNGILIKKQQNIKALISEKKIEGKSNTVGIIFKYNVTNQNSKNCKNMKVKKNKSFVKQTHKLINNHLQQSDHLIDVLSANNNKIISIKHPTANLSTLKN